MQGGTSQGENDTQLPAGGLEITSPSGTFYLKQQAGVLKFKY